MVKQLRRPSCPSAGCLHPNHEGYFSSPAEYIKWYKRHGPLGAEPTYPTVAVLLYRKHVITEQMYIGQLIGNMEEQGVRPIPIFINGIEAHTVVSTAFTALLSRNCGWESGGAGYEIHTHLHQWHSGPCSGNGLGCSPY